MTEEENIEQQIPEIAEEKEPSSFRLIITLGIAGLLSGIVLVSVYLYTLPMIEANKAEALRKAIYKVLPECDYFETLELRSGQLLKWEEGDKQESGSEVKRIFLGYDKDKEVIGFAIPGAEAGFQDIIGVIFGYNAGAQMIIGFEVLESKETPGLGDKIFKDLDFQENFKALAVAPEIIPVKKGKKLNPNEVETITGATISSKAIVRLLNNSISEWQKAINEYMEANNIKMGEK